MIQINIIHQAETLKFLQDMPDNIVDCVVTSPPYWAKRDYGFQEQLGLEETPYKYIDKMVDVFMEVYRVLKPEGTLWLNIGDTYSSHKDCSSQPQTIAKDSLSENAHVITKEKSYSKNTKLLKSVGLKNKDLIGIPWLLALSLRDAGWYLRQDIIWNKPNPMPESVRDRCTTAHEYIFLLTKSKKYYFDYEAIQTKATTAENRPGGVERNRVLNYSSKENDNPQAYLKKTNIGGNKHEQLRNSAGPMSRKNTNQEFTETGMANKRSVWTVATKPLKEAHFASFPQELITDCIKAGCPENGIVLDPFIGSGTTGIVARKLNRNFIGIEFNSEYIAIAEKRFYNELGMFA